MKIVISTTATKVFRITFVRGGQQGPPGPPGVSTWGDITDKPTAFPSSIALVGGLQTALDERITKSATPYIIYATPQNVSYTADVNPLSIPFRNSEGLFFVGYATDREHPVQKGYVDDMTASFPSGYIAYGGGEGNALEGGDDFLWYEQQTLVVGGYAEQATPGVRLFLKSSGYQPGTPIMQAAAALTSDIVFTVSESGNIQSNGLLIADYANDAAAAAAGIAVGELYHNAGAVRIRLT